MPICSYGVYMLKSQFLFVSILLLSTSSYAAVVKEGEQSEEYKEIDSLTMTGFKIEKESSKSLILHYDDKKEVIISSEKFSHHEQAQKFCNDQGSKLDATDMALVLAMSGAASVSPVIESSLRFTVVNPNDKQRSVSGIMYWSGKADEVVVMLNGQGSGTETVPVSAFDKRIAPKVSAICTKDIPPLKKDVKKIDASLSKLNLSKADSSNNVVDTSRSLKKESAPVEKVIPSKSTLSTAK